LYIEIVRGVPLITVLFTAGILLPIFLPEGMTVERVVREIVGFTAFTAAYLAEVVRGGLQSIGRGQNEAAKALGLNTAQILWFIILPQALRNVIPAIVGQFISLFKDTSLVAIIGLLELAGIANSVISQQEFLGRQNEVLVFIAAIYLVCCYAMTYASRRLEKRLGVGER
jgi:general L-amino acid transport system permease protein